MKTLLVVEAIDETRKAINVTAARLLDSHGASPALFAADPMLGMTADVSTIALGAYQLRLDIAAHPTLLLKGTVMERGGQRMFRFDAPSPKCITVSRARAVRGSATSPAVITLRIMLAKRHEEIILIAGWDYHGNGNMALYAKTRRDDLYTGKTHRITSATDVTKDVAVTRAIHDYTRVTLFDFNTGDRIRWIKGQKDWLQLDRELQGTVRTHLGTPSDDPINQQKRHNDDAISITHVYDYVKQLGAAFPACLIGFHVFSHSWAGGPILADTFQETQYTPGGALANKRDPGDKDGRSKDFTVLNMGDIGAFKAAFQSTAHVKIWGCLATTLYHDLIKAASAARSEGKAPTEVLHFVADGTPMDKSQQDIEAMIRNDIIPRSYMSKLAKLIGIPVFGSPLGVGSNLMDIGTKSYMYINQERYGRDLRWLKAALGLQHDDSGYLRYE